MTDDELNLLPDASPDIVPAPTSEPTPEPEPTAPPMEVISVDELLERLTRGDEPSPEESAEPGTEEPPLDPGDTPAVELAPDTLAVQGSLDGLGEQTAQLTELVADIRAHIARPALTTPFAEYTVSEALLLLLFLSVFVSACARMLKGGFSWLRS